MPWSPVVFNYLLFESKPLLFFEPLNVTEEYKAVEMSGSFPLIVAIVQRCKHDYAIVSLHLSVAISLA